MVPKYILSMVSLNRNAHKILYVDEDIVSGGLQKPNSVFPLGTIIKSHLGIKIQRNYICHILK